MTDVDAERAIRANWQAQLTGMDAADTALLAAQFTPDATLRHMTGHVQALDDWLDGIRAGTFVYHEVLPRTVDVTVDGERAWLTGRILTGHRADGRGQTWRLELDQDFSNVDGRWLCTASRVTTW